MQVINFACRCKRRLTCTRRPSRADQAANPIDMPSYVFVSATRDSRVSRVVIVQTNVRLVQARCGLSLLNAQPTSCRRDLYFPLPLLSHQARVLHYLKLIPVICLFVSENSHVLMTAFCASAVLEWVIFSHNRYFRCLCFSCDVGLVNWSRTKFIRTAWVC